MLAALPERIQRLAPGAFHLFEENPAHTSLRVHQLVEAVAFSHQGTQGNRIKIGNLGGEGGR